MNPEFEADVTAISMIEAVPTILDVVCRTTGMGFAAVARVTEDRWIACSVRDTIEFGLQPGGELKIETTICNEIRDHRQAVIIDNVKEDLLYSGHHTPLMYGFQSYISMPIVLPNGMFFGTLCAIDPRPMRLNSVETVGMFKLFAELIAFHLDAHTKLATTQADLLGERQNTELREQFIAVLGHDLKNPLASIDAGARMLTRTPLDDKAKTIVTLIQSSVGRMSTLIDNVLDFARGRLGGGLVLENPDIKPLNPILEQVIAELRLAYPDRSIDVELCDPVAIRADHGRIGQLLSNLLANALTHGEQAGHVRVSSRVDGQAFELSVSNGGEAILPETAQNIFKPFFRAAVRPSRQGLGLGLYIASEIASAHNGTLVLDSDEDETRFVFRMPLD